MGSNNTKDIKQAQIAEPIARARPFEGDYDSYAKMSREERRLFIPRSYVAKTFNLKHKEIHYLPFIVKHRGRQAVYLYRITDIKQYLAEHPRIFDKRKCLTKHKAMKRYHLTEAEIMGLPYHQEGFAMYFEHEVLRTAGGQSKDNHPAPSAPYPPDNPEGHQDENNAYPLYIGEPLVSPPQMEGSVIESSDPQFSDPCCSGDYGDYSSGLF